MAGFSDRSIQEFVAVAKRAEALGVLQDGDSRPSLVNLHSLRRYFITEVVNAGQPPHLVSLVVGHSVGRKGMTLSRYWSGAAHIRQ